MMGAVGILMTVIIVLAVLALVGVVVYLFIGYVKRQNESVNEKRRLMQICEKRIFDLLSINKNKPYEPQLLIIIEKLKYCDKIGATSVDEKIVGAVIRLEKELNLAEPKADSIFEELTALMSQRNAEMADNKRGGF